MRTKKLLFLVACLIFSLNIKAQDDYLKITDLSQIQNGSSVILAARHDSLSTTSYYAMKNDVAGKLQGVMFTTSVSDDGVILPTEIIDNESSYCWTVGVSEGKYTFINPDGDMVGYGSSGTDFVKNGVNSTWSIAAATSGDATVVPNYDAFVITNVGVPNRSVAFRQYNGDELYEKFAPYSNSESNMESVNYYFYLDIFVKSSEVVPVVSLPAFSPAGGDYLNSQNVVISCATEGATIYYTLDGKNPTDTSMVYTSPIEISKTTTVKAFAKKEGMHNSGIATVKYNIMEPVTVSFYNNGILLDTRTLAKGHEIGELPDPIVPDGFSFNGWTDDDISGSVNTMPDIMTSTSVVDETMNLYAVYSVSGDNCLEVEASSFKQSDVAVIVVGRDGKYYAMSQVKGSSGQPLAAEIRVSNGKIIGGVSDDIKWNIVYDKGSMTIYPNADKERWLYCTSGSSNNSVRIGDNDENDVFEIKTVEIDGVVYSDYLYNMATERFVGVYNDDEVFDWRAYKLTASGAFPANIKNQSYHFFKCEGNSVYCTSVDEPQSQIVAVNTTWGNVSVVNKIIVERGAVLTINGAISCTDPENLIIKDGGQLVHGNNGVNAVIEKEIEGYDITDEGWYMISSPLVGYTNFSDIGNLMTNDYDMYRYDEPTSMWQNAKEISHDFNDMEVGRGYLYANKNDVTLSFSGEVNNNDVEYFLTKTDDIALSGFHLIGNPYAHNIYKGRNAAIDDDNLVKGHYVLSNSGAWEAVVFDDEPITPCQSILVKTKREGKINIKKTNALPIEDVSDEAFAVMVNNSHYKDVAYALFNNDGGLEKINHKNMDVPMIYIPLDGEDYAVASIDEHVREIPVSFKAKTMGEYTIKVSADDKYEHMYLVDNYTGDVVNMLLEEYTFMATSSDDPDRFTLKLYDINSIEEAASADIFAYVYNNELVVGSVSDKSIVQIFDILGRPVRCIVNCEGDKQKVSLDDFKSGVYIVRKIDDKVVKTQKFVVK